MKQRVTLCFELTPDRHRVRRVRRYNGCVTPSPTCNLLH